MCQSERAHTLGTAPAFQANGRSDLHICQRRRIKEELTAIVTLLQKTALLQSWSLSRGSQTPTAEGLLSVQCWKLLFTSSLITEHTFGVHRTRAWLQKRLHKPSMVEHTCDPSTREAGAGGSQIPGQSGLYSETLSQQKKKKKKKKMRKIPHKKMPPGQGALGTTG
jgi:hypothetical protein